MGFSLVVLIPLVMMSLSKWLIPALIGGAVIYFGVSEAERERFRAKDEMTVSELPAQ